MGIVEFPVREVRTTGEELLKINPQKNTALLLINLAKAAKLKGQKTVVTDNPCVIGTMRTARKNFTSCVAIYGGFQP